MACLIHLDASHKTNVPIAPANAANQPLESIAEPLSSSMSESPGKKRARYSAAWARPMARCMYLFDKRSTTKNFSKERDVYARTFSDHTRAMKATVRAFA